jgi:flavin reductase (DIM6/NTAB) family NADH-FMN oxidoreductase RutF
MIGQYPICIECQLTDVVPLPSHNLFLGEVVAAYADQNCLAGGKPDIEEIDPFVLPMPDNNYRILGPQVGKTGSAGKDFKG